MKPLSDAGPLPCPFCPHRAHPEPQDHNGYCHQYFEDGARCNCPGFERRRASSASAGGMSEKELRRASAGVLYAAAMTPYQDETAEWNDLASKLAALADKEKP